MRIVFLSLLSILMVSCNNSKPEKVVSKHSSAFNNSVQSAMDRYHALTEAFVNWDSAAAASKALELKTKLSDIKLNEFPANVKETADGSLHLAQQDLEGMTVNIGLTEKRHLLNSLTQHIYKFLEAVQYDEKKIYLQECPMAFNDSIPADWLSETDSIRNPYFGLHHPTYGHAMIDCGSTKSTIDFTARK
jgi:hypothetical protein